MEAMVAGVGGGGLSFLGRSISGTGNRPRATAVKDHR